MKIFPVCLLALGLAAPAAAQASPLGKTIELLNSLAAKVKAEGEAEAKAYKEYVDWCDEASTNTGFEIKTATSQKDSLEATIGKCAGDIDAASSKIETLAASIAKDESELSQATGLREKEQADFVAEEKELMETIDVISRAMAIIEREMAKHPGAFVQVDGSNSQSIVNALSSIVDAVAFTMADKQKLTALIQDQQKDSDEEFGAPAAAAYKSKSSGILDVLEDLKEKAEEQLSGLRQAESEAQHNFNMVKQSLSDQIKADSKELAETKASKASTEEAKATAEGDLQTTIKDLQNAKDSLAEVNSGCMQAAQDHEATVAAREEELKVIAEATKILQESTSGAEDRSYSLIQYAQVSSIKSHADVAKLEVTTLVKKLAKEHHSAALAQLASRISAIMRLGARGGEDVFGKVKGLISDMISKLEAEAESDATEKAYCDEQMTKTQAKSDTLNSDISALSAKIDKASAASAKLKEEVKQVQADLAALSKSQAEMDKIRSDESAEYVAAKSDLEAGLAGVRKALGVLKQYYGGAALLQAGGTLKDRMTAPEGPAAHSKAAGAGQGIIGLLEVVESDFAKNLASVEAAESDAASEYEKITQQNSVTKTMKEQDVVYSTKEYKSLDKSIAEMSADRETTDSELAAVTDYFAKIKDRCIAKPETYSSRASRRTAEITGLKEALRILEDETALVQRSKRAHAGPHSQFLARH
jgi:hypothetical protein